MKVKNDDTEALETARRTAARFEGYLLALEDASSAPKTQKALKALADAADLPADEGGPNMAGRQTHGLPAVFLEGYKKALADARVTHRSRWGQAYAYTKMLLREVEDEIAQAAAASPA